jgi:hypothetical protein
VKWLLAFALGFALAGSVQAIKKAFGAGPDAFVQMLERREGVFPGQTKVLPDCNCTVRYLGTVRHGRVYSVQIEKLD